MAPITDEQVHDLKDLIRKLESRVHELEQKISAGGSLSTPSESMRMILIGPPGAGMLYRSALHNVRMLILF